MSLIGSESTKKNGLTKSDKVIWRDDVAVLTHSVFVNVAFYQTAEDGTAG